MKKKKERMMMKDDLRRKRIVGVGVGGVGSRLA